VPGVTPHGGSDWAKKNRGGGAAATTARRSTPGPGAGAGGGTRRSTYRRKPATKHRTPEKATTYSAGDPSRAPNAEKPGRNERGAGTTQYRRSMYASRRRSRPGPPKSRTTSSERKTPTRRDHSPPTATNPAARGGSWSVETIAHVSPGKPSRAPAA